MIIQFEGSELAKFLGDILVYLEDYNADEIPVSGLIEVVIPYIQEELFTLKRNYKIVVAVD